MEVRTISKSLCLILLCCIPITHCSNTQFAGKDAAKGQTSAPTTPIPAANVAAGSNPADPANGNLNQNTSPTQSAAPGSGIIWASSTPITDFGTLEKCKWDILQKTGDTALCWKCFQDWQKNNYKITAGECGCAPAGGNSTTSTNTTSGTDTTTTSSSATATATSTSTNTGTPSVADLNAFLDQLKKSYEASQKQKSTTGSGT